MKSILALVLAAVFLASCDPALNSSDTLQREQQERLLQEGTSAIGMPSIVNFREKRLLKDIIEMRDNETLTTYTYIVAEQTGALILLGESIGYGIPAATQFTNPQKIEASTYEGGYAIIPQADPNGLFSPESAEGTWVMLKDPGGKTVKPVYVEPRIIVSPFRLK